MIVYLNANGTIEQVVPQNLTQGSNNETLIVVGANLSNYTSLNAIFKLPNKQVLAPRLMTKQDSEYVLNNEIVNVWTCTINKSVTNFSGTLNLTIDATDVNGVKVNSYTGAVQIAPTNAPTYPQIDESAEEIFNQIFEAYAYIQGRLAEKQDIYDEDLQTESKEIVGAINELNAKETQNAGDIMELQGKVEDIENGTTIIDIYQTKQDNSLETSEKTIVGAINQLNTKSREIDVLQNEIDNIENGTIIVDKARKDADGNVISETYQKKSDNSLDTVNKTVVGGINELKDQTIINAEDIQDAETEISNIKRDYATTDYVDNLFETISGGGSKSYVFNTKQQFLDWLNGTYTRPDGLLPRYLNIGDMILIVETGVPDYWLKSKSEPITINDFAEYEVKIDIQSVSVDNITITKNTSDEIQAVALKDAFVNLETDSVSYQDFDGAVNLSQEQYDTLVQYGSISVGGQTIIFDNNKIYITPDTAPDLSGDVSQLRTDVDGIINNTTIIKPNANESILVGSQNAAALTSTQSVIIGKNAKAVSKGVAIGYDAMTTVANGGVAVGDYAETENGVAIGREAEALGDGVAIGNFAETEDGIAIGGNETTPAQALASGSIQIGGGTNNTANTVQIVNDNIYNYNTHTLAVQNIELNGADLQTTLNSLGGGVSQEDLDNVINGTTQITYKSNSFRAGGAADRDYANTISIGSNSVVNNQNAIAIGSNAIASKDANIAIGQAAKAIAQGTIQLGGGDARTPYRLNVKGWDIFDTQNNILMAEGLQVNSIELNGSDLQTQINSKAEVAVVDQNTVDINALQSSVSQLSPKVARALLTPMSAPATTELVAVDDGNSQVMVSVGSGLQLQNGVLSSTGGVQVVDNLTSSSTSSALSANQGRILNNDINNLNQTVNLKANQSSLDTTNQNVTANTNNINSLTTNKADANGSNINTISNWRNSLQINPVVLWSGSLSNGSSVTISGISDWQVIMVDEDTIAVLNSSGTEFKGPGGKGYGNDYLTIKGVTLGVSGNTLTNSSCAWQDLGQKGLHTAGGSVTINKITGLIKKGA